MLQLSSDLFLRCENCKRIIHIPRRRLYVEKAQHLINDDGVGMVSVYTIEGTPRCPSCRSEFSYVITALEFTENVVDDITAKAEGAMFLTEPEFTPEQRGNSNQTQRPQSLIDSVVHICDERYLNALREKHPCGDCTHDCGHPLQGSSCDCISCLEEVHFHKYNGRKTYNCPNLVNCYTCRYTNKFASEIGYALEALPCLKRFTDCRILSIGCGPAPDLMAFEKYRAKHCPSATIQYKGFDRNPYWWAVHDQIGRYCDESNSMLVNFHYEDALDFFSNNGLPEANILVLQYVISHFHNTDQFDQLADFFESITDNIIAKMQPNSVILIHDINHNRFGRDQFEDLIEYLKKKGIKGHYTKRYFDTNIKNDHQRYGARYPSTTLLYPPARAISSRYCRNDNSCSGASLLIELGGQQS